MGSRRNLPPAHEERFSRASGMMHHGPLPAVHHPMEPLPPPAFLENTLASQAAEIAQLVGDNQKLATSHLALRQDLATAQQEAERLREHIKSTQTEGDIQIRILLDKIAKREADIRARNDIKKELQEAHLEAQSLVTSRMELIAQIQQATQELDKARAEVKKIPEMHAELDSLRQEHQGLRKTFEYEKGVNTEKVEQMKIMEKNIIAMTGEVERLRAQVLNAKRRASGSVPYSAPNMSTDNSYPPPFTGNGGYADNFSGPHLQGTNLYPSGGFPVGPSAISGGDVAAGNPAWGGTYDNSNTKEMAVRQQQL